MNNSEKLQGYIELYKRQFDMFDKRRSVEWKVTFGLWTGIIVATGFLAGKIETELSALIIYFVIWLVFSFVWTKSCWYANKVDQIWSYVYRNRIEFLIGFAKEEKDYEEPNKWDFLKDWSRKSQIIITFILLGLNWYILNIY